MTISEHMLAFINDQLINNEHAHDEELIELFVSQGINEDDARSALEFRNEILVKPLAYLVIENGQFVLKQLILKIK